MKPGVYIGLVGPRSSNKGNIPIDLGFKNVCKMTGLDIPEVGLFQEMPTGISIVVSAGCTTLTATGCTPDPNSGWLSDPGCPEIIMCGGSIWNIFPPSDAIAKKCIQPIGVRDPWTEKFLEGSGYKTTLIGCPSVFVEPIDPREDFDIVSLPEKKPQEFLEFAKSKLGGDAIGVVHIESDKGVFDALGMPYVIDLVSAYSRARRVITGRLHGALLAHTFRKNTEYIYDPKDSRTSLWEIRNRIPELKERYVEYLLQNHRRVQ